MEHNKYTQDHVDGLSGPKAWFTKFCNTFGIVDAALGAGIASGYWDGHPGYRQKFADNAVVGNATFVGCTTAFTTGFGVRAVRAQVWLKNYLMGVSTSNMPTVGMFWQLQVATGTGAFGTYQASTGTSVIDCRFAARATSTLLLSGITPDNQAIAAARIAIFPSSANFAITDSASFDCCIDAVPGS